MGIDRIDYVGQPVCYDVFLKKPPSYQLKSGDRVRGAKRMHFPELRNQILGTFDGSGRELREEQDVNCKHRKRTLGRLPSPIDLDRVCHGLEGVEREAQRNGPRRNPHYRWKVLEGGHQSQIRGEAQNEPGLSGPPGSFLDIYPSAVVQQNQNEHDKDILRSKRNIK